MKNFLVNKLLGSAVVFVLLISTLLGVGCASDADNLRDFYTVVKESQELLDIVADDIYSNWHDAIYDDSFGGNINTAIYYAQLDNSENLQTIDSNDAIIKELYKKVKETDLRAEVKDVMNAYNEYYELVVNVSGSYNSYSASKETLKKALASAIKNLELEL